MTDDELWTIIPEWERELLDRQWATEQEPEYGTEDYWRVAVLFNDITYAPTSDPLLFSDRQMLTRWLWAQGWRRDVRDEDINDRKGPAALVPDPLRRRTLLDRLCWWRR